MCSQAPPRAAHQSIFDVMKNRREARVRVMQALYASEMANGEDADHIVETIIAPRLRDDEATMAFAQRLFQWVHQHVARLDAIIESHSKNWDLSRIALIDRIALRIALAEFLAFEDIPPKASINEAIEIVKRYSTAKSGRFVNGILDAALLDLYRRRLLKKSGRGLVGMDSIQKRFGPSSPVAAPEP